MPESLIKVVLRTGVTERLSREHPIVKNIEKKIEDDFFWFEEWKKHEISEEMAKKAYARRIFGGIISLAQHGIIVKAIHYAKEFDKTFGLDYAYMLPV